MIGNGEKMSGEWGIPPRDHAPRAAKRGGAAAGRRRGWRAWEFVRVRNLSFGALLGSGRDPRRRALDCPRLALSGHASGITSAALSVASERTGGDRSIALCLHRRLERRPTLWDRDLDHKREKPLTFRTVQQKCDVAGCVSDARRETTLS